MTRRSRLEHAHNRLLQRVASARASGNEREIRLANTAYCDAYSSHFFAAEKVKARRNFASVSNSHLTIEEIAQRSLVWDASDEIVSVDVGGLRSDFSARLIFNYGAVNKTRQTVVKELLYRPNQTDNAQTLLRGGANRAVAKAIENFSNGFQHVAQIDIKRCYPSFDSGKTATYFSLPERVSANSLGMQNLKLWPSRNIQREWLHLSGSEDADRIFQLFVNMFGDELATALPGLIEGSMVSPFLVEMMLAPTCGSLRASGLGIVICYADNFLLMAETRAELMAMLDRLRNELAAHPVGAHEVHVSQYAHGQDDIDFLGYRLSPSGNRLVALPGAKVIANAKAIRKQTYSLIHSGMPLSRKRRELHYAAKRHWNVLNSLWHWEDRAAYHVTKIQGLRTVLESAAEGPDTSERTTRYRYRPRP